MSAAHTAGPWKVARFGGVPAYYSVYEPGAYSVADFCSDVPGIDNGANARLCAAAPTLLEALSEIVAERDRVIAEESAMSPIGQPMFDDSFGIKLARAALAAAEGGAK